MGEVELIATLNFYLHLWSFIWDTWRFNKSPKIILTCSLNKINTPCNDLKLENF